MPLSRGSREWSFARGIVLAAAVSGGCYAGVGYAEDRYDEAPPPAIVSSAEPFYYEGHPNYWYRGAWHYRDDGHWRRYRSEPEPMRRWRTERRAPPPANPPAARPLPPPAMREGPPHEGFPR